MPRRSEKRLYRCGRMALPAHKSLVEAQELASGHVKILSWVIMPIGWRNSEFGRFWGFWGFVAWKARHRIGYRARILPTPFSRKPLTEGKGKWAICMVVHLEICSALQAQCRCKICCAFTTSVKYQTLRLLPLIWISPIGLYQYRVIQVAATKEIAETPLMYNRISI